MQCHAGDGYKRRDLHALASCEGLEDEVGFKQLWLIEAVDCTSTAQLIAHPEPGQ
jgi:hypothetical protein